jgi:hypothetical protein
MAEEDDDFLAAFILSIFYFILRFSYIFSNEQAKSCRNGDALPN